MSPGKRLTTMTYAVVPSHGCYGSGSKVRPLSTHSTLARAERKAERATSEYRAAMRRYGGSSGGYRVVEARASWLGWELDRMPSLGGAL